MGRIIDYVSDQPIAANDVFIIDGAEGGSRAVTMRGAAEKMVELSGIGGEVNRLKEDLLQSNDGRESVRLLSEFVNGSVYEGEIQTYGENRVSSKDILTFTNATKITIDSGFWIGLHFFVNGSYSSVSSWTANSYNVPAGSNVRIVIRRATEDSTEIADIDEFTRAVTINTGIQNQINNLNTDLSGKVTTATNNVNQALRSYGQISASNVGALGWNSVTKFDANRVYGIGSDITEALVSDLPYYGGYGQLTITSGIYQNIYKKYEYTNANNDTWVAWQTNNNTALSAWKKLASADLVSFKTIASRTLFDANSKVIFIGDSIVAGVGGTGWQQTSGRKLITYDGTDLYANDEGTCWANMMRDYLTSKYGCTAYNNGLSGFNSVNIPQNISQLVPSDTTHVIACWGINDRAYNYNTITGYQTVIDYCNSIGAKIVPITICPCLQPDNTYAHTQYEILTRVKTVCANNNMELCDLFSAVHNYFYVTGKTFNTDYLPDNLHPNDAMYTIMYNLIKGLLCV